MNLQRRSHLSCALLINNVCLSNVTITDANLSGTSVRMSSLKDMSIADCCIDVLTVNGVDELLRQNKKAA